VTASPDVIVIGGGAVGAACARELAVAGRSVLVLERGGDQDRGEAWRASAGMLAPQIETRQDGPIFDLGIAARERYAPLAEELLAATGIDIGLWQEGVARVAASEADAMEVRSQTACQRQRGQPCDWLDADEVRARWPWLGPSHGALWAPRDGALDPQALVRALRADLLARGARIVPDEAMGLERRGTRVDAVVGASGERYRAAHVLLAAGAWSNRLRGLPRPVSVEPVRGQMAALPWPAAAPRSIVFGRHCYLVARGDEALAGSTMEYSGFDASVTPEGIEAILDKVTALCPALDRRAVRRTWAGLRPVTPDGLPIIGREPAADNLWLAAGHGRNGILFAAYTGQLVAQLLAGELPEQDLAAVSPARFWRW
jgi:glycine oxidase